MTHFGPKEDQAMLTHTAQSLPLIVRYFETLLGCSYPYPSLQQAFVPSGFPPIASAGLQMLPTSLLFTERCVEQVPTRLLFSVLLFLQAPSRFRLLSTKSMRDSF